MNAAPIAAAPAATSTQPKAAQDPARAELRDAARQFEAILLRQMLASARTTDFGGGGAMGKTDDTFREMRDARFAELASNSGQLGFAAAIERQLARHLPAEAR